MQFKQQTVGKDSKICLIRSISSFFTRKITRNISSIHHVTSLLLNIISFFKYIKCNNNQNQISNRLYSSLDGGMTSLTEDIAFARSTIQFKLQKLQLFIFSL
jgi:hypothetical protein